MEKSSDLCPRSGFPLRRSLRLRRLREDDRISSLSDDILLVIISLLPFKEVVKTSLLSRRWLNLWEHTPVLHFHAPVSKARLISDEERRDYVEWVNRVLQEQHKGRILKEFKIVCQLDGCYQKDIDNWLVFALARKVQFLEFIAGKDVCGPFLDFGNSRFPQSDIKCLRSLSLNRVKITGEAINFVLLNCPFLERLEVLDSSTLVYLVISDPNLVLKYLVIKYNSYLEVLSISNFNLVSLDIVTVTYLTLRNLPMLVEFFITGAQYLLSRYLSRASSCFSQLEALTISGFDLKDAAQLANNDPFTKLKRLVIIALDWRIDLTKLISFVNACPRLEELVFMLRWFHKRVGTSTFKRERRRSTLKSKSLKVFEFVGYHGYGTDVELIKRMVKYAVSLEKIIIDPRNSTDTGVDTRVDEVAEKARSNVLQQFDSLRKSIPPRISLLLR